MKNKKSKKNKCESLVLGKMLQKIAPQIGASVMIEPEWGIVGQITFSNGSRSYFRYNTLDLNPVGSSDIAKDKDFSNFFMRQMGYKLVPDSRSFFADYWAKAIGKTDRDIDAAYRHAKKIGFPVIVKPNSGSQGSGVSLVHNKTQFYKAMRTIFLRDRVALVQRKVHGKDYRVVVLDDDIISAYERIPLNIVGDGKSSIKRLLKLKQRSFVASSRDTQIGIDDPRIRIKLKQQEMSLGFVPERDQRVYLLDNANLSTGGDSVDVTEKVHPDYKKLAIRLTHDMGLRLCGVDFMLQGDISNSSSEYWILEINAAPGLDHYVKLGKEQESIVEELYLRVLKQLDHSRQSI